jgi:hypothetical protein
LRTQPKQHGAGVDPGVRANAQETPNEIAGQSPATPALDSMATSDATGSAASEVENIRKLLLGSLPEQYERQIERLEVRIAESAADLHIALSALERRLEKRIVGVDAANRTSNGELRQQLLEEMRVVSEAVETYHAKAMQRVEQGLQELQSAKLDQATFSNFLESLARYLGREDAPRRNPQEAR